jgi:hypothetical protein
MMCAGPASNLSGLDCGSPRLSRVGRRRNEICYGEERERCAVAPAGGIPTMPRSGLAFADPSGCGKFHSDLQRNNRFANPKCARFRLMNEVLSEIHIGRIVGVAPVSGERS